VSAGDRGEALFGIAAACVALGVLPLCAGGASDSVTWQWVWASLALLLELVGLFVVVAGTRLIVKGDH
jgi:hypothetical protein